MYEQSIRTLRCGLIFGCVALSILSTGVRAMTDNLETLAPCPQSPNCVCSDEDLVPANTLRPLSATRRMQRKAPQMDNDSLQQSLPILSPARSFAL